MAGLFALRVLAAVVATMAFSILFGAPKKHWLWCSLAGGMAWFVNSLLIELGTGDIVACVCAALALTCFARLLSFARRAPLILFLVPGIFPLVPGAKLYFTATYLFASDFAAGASEGFETLKFAGAITLGILFGVSLPVQLFTPFIPKDPKK